eukprot:1834570-Rhodomonas_salina.3
MVESDVATSPFLELAVEGAKTQCMVVSNGCKCCLGRKMPTLTLVVAGCQARGCCLRVHQLSANYTAEAPACAVTIALLCNVCSIPSADHPHVWKAGCKSCGHFGHGHWCRGHVDCLD